MGLLDAINIGSSGLLAMENVLKSTLKTSQISIPLITLEKIPVLIAKEDVSFQGLMTRMKDNVYQTGYIPHVPGGVALSGTIEDPTEADLIYRPGHPDADRNGYVRKSNVNPMVDIADANMTSRAYEASLAIISVTKAMGQKAVEIGR
ncbi:MAG: hypothetical protein MZU97_09190 [Bacillus subtilis]|nr:hypothetical protein [Bacillus subtilis]